MDGQFKIEKVYACIVRDDDNTEGVPAVTIEGGMILPLMGADIDRLESLLIPAAEKIARTMGKPVEICEFTGRTLVRRVEPT